MATATAKTEKEQVQAPETTETAKAPEATAKTEKKAEEKIYNFTSVNKFLTCSGLGVQFIDGKATTKSLDIAKALVKIEGVELVEK